MSDSKSYLTVEQTTPEGGRPSSMGPFYTEIRCPLIRDALAVDVLLGQGEVALNDSRYVH